MTPRESNNWSEYRLLVLEFCEETKDRLDAAETEIHDLKLEINTMKVRDRIVSAGIGFIVSLVVSLVPIIVQFILGRL